MLITRIRRLDWPLLAVAIVLLAVYGIYTLAFVLETPYPGVALTVYPQGWRVNDSAQPGIEVDDLFVRIGDLSFEEFQNDRLATPFAGSRPGESIEVQLADGTVVTVLLPQPKLEDYFRRLIGTLWFVPFWLAGTAVLLFLRPRDVRWRLLVSFMYLTGLWSVLGGISNWRIGGSLILFRVITWLMVPVYLHLHTAVPSSLLSDRLRRIGPLRLIYLAAIVAVGFELMGTFQANLAQVWLILAIFVSVGFLIYRIVRAKSSASDRLAARLMLAGIGLAFGPGILVVFIPLLFDFVLPGTLGLGVAIFALPAMPIFYTYALYKRQLGALEFRTNRLLSLYSFALLYPTVFIIFLLLGEQWISSSGSRTFYLLVVSIIFALATPPLLDRFQHWLNRLAYGTEHDPDDILRVFAKQIPSALSRDRLQRLLMEEITPILLIRQSALYLLEGELQVALYAQAIPDENGPVTMAQLRRLLGQADRYRPPELDSGDRFDWIRLVIPLVTRDETLGLWVFGRRDPDDFYPQNDIDLLTALANQIAPVIENIRLYEALQRQAQDLADEVTSRTAELKAERDRTQAVLDSAGEGIFFTDPVGVILYANPQMALTTGYDSQELVGRSLELWEGDANSPDSYRELWTAIYSGEAWSGDMLLRRIDGDYRDISLTISPIRSEEGTLTGYVGVQSDISKLKEVDRLKSNIISSVSHELKTPLTTIKTYLMLLRRGKQEKQQNYYQVLDRESERLGHIIEDLLDLSALDTGKLPSNLEPLDLQEVVNSALTSCMTVASVKGTQLRAALDANNHRMLADRRQLEQVLSNLVVNAVNYSPAGGQITITATNTVMNDQPAVRLSVADTGPGIPEDELPYLFERFFRGRVARDSNSPGTGLGLAICREIVERHGGQITAENRATGGAVFSIYMPAVIGEPTINGQPDEELAPVEPDVVEE